MLTKGARLSWLLFAFLTACFDFGEPQQSLEPNIFYERDLEITINGYKVYGAGVVPAAPKYDIKVKSKGKLDLLLVRTCHRNWKSETHEKEAQLQIIPVPGIEDNGPCAMRFEGYEKDKGRHSWGLIEIERPDVTQKATITCNGYQYEGRGISICQSFAGLIQRITFPLPVIADPEERCAGPVSNDGGKTFEFPIVKGECTYAFYEKTMNRWHQLTTIGYEQVLVRGD